MNFLLDPAAALQDLLRFDLVVPEIRRGRASFYLGELISRTCGLKDSSGDRRLVSQDPDTGV
jgi:hypothetical protein